LPHELTQLDAKLVVCFTDDRPWIKRRAIRWSLVATQQQQKCFCAINSQFYIPGFNLKTLQPGNQTINYIKEWRFTDATAF
jgi:hypothetical protein